MSLDPALDESEHKFIHDLSNPLAIVYGNVKLIVSKLESDRNAMDTEAVFERLNKTIKHFEKINELIEERRKIIRGS